jgi:hypothetical protein
MSPQQVAVGIGRFVAVGLGTGVLGWIASKILDRATTAATSSQAGLSVSPSSTTIHGPWNAAIPVPLWVLVVAVVFGLVAGFWPVLYGWALLATDALSQRRKPLLLGHVVRFEWLDADDLSQHENEEWEEAWKAPATIVEAIMDDKRLWYKTWLQIEAPIRPTKAIDWSFQVLDLAGNPRQAVPLEVQWQAPRTWPSIDFHSLSQVQSMYLQPHTLYNVFVYLRCPLELKKETLAQPLVVSFRDNNGTLIVLEARA